MTSVGEAISVIASFGQPYKIRPVRFRWSGRLFEIKEITYAWKTKEGQNTIYRFSVSSGTALYELAFDASSLIWRLERVADPV